MLARQESDAVAVKQLQILDDQVCEHLRFRSFKDALVALCELEDVLVQKLEAVFFTFDKVEEGDKEAVGVLGGAEEGYDEIVAANFPTLFADEVALAQFGASGQT